MTDRGFEQANRHARRELEELAASIRGDGFARPVDDEGWTVGTVFGHLAFWDRYLEGRWRHALANNLASPIALPEELPDFINGAGAPLWRELAGRAAVAQALAAADSLDVLIASLPDASVDAVVAEGHPRLVDRSLHRRDHIAQIRRGL